jgi:hypothetical protein
MGNQGVGRFYKCYYTEHVSRVNSGLIKVNVLIGYSAFSDKSLFRTKKLLLVPRFPRASVMAFDGKTNGAVLH